MKKQACIMLAGLGLLALGLGLYVAGSARAQEGAEKAAILKIADAIGKGEADAAKTQAKALAGKIEEIEEVMNLMRPRKIKDGKVEGGLGVGDKPGAITPDGIEQKLVIMGRDAPSAAKAQKEAAALQKMSHVVAAIAEVAIAKPDKKKPKEWLRYAKEMREAAPKLAEAAKSKSPAELKKAAELINNACNNCHSVFK